MSARLGDTQRLVLIVLDGVEEGEMPPTPYEIAERVASWMNENRPEKAKPRRPTSEAEAVNSSLRKLEHRGLVERLGRSAFGNGRTWGITAAGRKTLEVDLYD